MKPNPDAFYRPKHSSVPLQPYLLPPYYTLDNLSPNATAYHHHHSHHHPPSHAAGVYPGGEASGGALYGGVPSFSLSNPAEKHPFVLQRSSSGPSYELSSGLGASHFYEQPTQLDDLHQLQVPLQLKRETHFTPKTAHQKVMRQKQVFAEFNLKAKKQSTASTEQELLAPFKPVDSDGGGSLKSAKTQRMVKAASSFKNYTRVTHKSSPMGRRPPKLKPETSSTYADSEGANPKSPKSGWINPKTQYKEHSSVKDLRFRSRSSSQPHNNFSARRDVSPSATEIPQTHKSRQAHHVAKNSFHTTGQLSKRTLGTRQSHPEFELDSYRESQILQTPGFPKTGGGGGGGTAAILKQQTPQEDSSSKSLKRVEVENAMKELESAFAEKLENQRQEIKELKLVVTILAKENQKLKKKQKVTELLHNSQRVATSELESLRRENQALRGRITGLKRLFLRVSGLLEEIEDEQLTGLGLVQQVLTKELHSAELVSQVCEIQDFRLCAICKKEVPKPIKIQNLARGESCGLLAERHALQREEGAEKPPEDLKGLVAVKILKMVRQRQKNKKASSPDPFDAIVTPSRGRQPMSYNNILPKRAYLLESPEEPPQQPQTQQEPDAATSK